MGCSFIHVCLTVSTLILVFKSTWGNWQSCRDRILCAAKFYLLRTIILKSTTPVCFNTFAWSRTYSSPNFNTALKPWGFTARNSKKKHTKHMTVQKTVADLSHRFQGSTHYWVLRNCHLPLRTHLGNAACCSADQRNAAYCWKCTFHCSLSLCVRLSVCQGVTVTVVFWPEMANPNTPWVKWQLWT